MDGTLSGVPLETFRFDIAGRGWTIRAVRDQGALLAASDALEAFPFGLLLWESAPVLAMTLAERADLVAGKGVLELGAGVGLAGLVAAHLGASHVRQTDHAPEALALARINATLNGINGVETERADWTDWTDGAQYDLILGSDVLYERAAHAPISAILERNLAPGGRVLLADPGRMDTPDFVADLENTGWRVARTVRTIDALVPAQVDARVTITLIEARRSAD